MLLILANIGAQNGESKKTWLIDQFFKYQTLWQILVSFQLFWATSWLASGVVFLNVSIMYAIKVEMSLKISHLSTWSLSSTYKSMCCEVPLRLCWTILRLLPRNPRFVLARITNNLKSNFLDTFCSDLSDFCTNTTTGTRSIIFPDFGHLKFFRELFQFSVF